MARTKVQGKLEERHDLGHHDAVFCARCLQCREEARQAEAAVERNRAARVQQAYLSTHREG